MTTTPLTTKAFLAKRRMPAGQGVGLLDFCVIPPDIQDAVFHAVLDAYLPARNDKDYGVRIAILQGSARQAQIVKARQVAAWVLRSVWGDIGWTPGIFPEEWAALEQIGALLRRDHTTIIYSIEKVTAAARGVNYRRELQGTLTRLGANLTEHLDQDRIRLVNERLEVQHAAK